MTNLPEPLAHSPEATAPFAVPAETLFDQLSTDRQRGLAADRLGKLRKRHGWNELVEAPAEPLWKKLLGQFNALVVWILIVAAVLAGMVGEWTDTLAILAIVVLNGAIGFVQEEKAGRALAALRRLSNPSARVVRDGKHQLIPARDLLPGDRIELEAGDHVPADARLIEGYAFRVQESALTGESLPIDKEPERVLSADTPLGDRRNMVYLGTVVVAGKAGAVVVATGMATELGGIAGMLRRSESEPTPLQRRLDELGKILVVVCLAIVGVIFALEMLRGGQWLEVSLRAVSLAVAAVPEGLPAVVTIALALGLQRMVRRNALIRRLPSVETLGSVTVICSDKTGTLTRNEMTVRELATGDERYCITGSGYTPRGEFFRANVGEEARSRVDGEEQPRGTVVDPRSEEDLCLALTVAARCNNSRIVPRGSGADNWQVIGDPTEGALAVAALKAGLETAGKQAEVLYEVPFDSERKMMSVVVAGSEGTALLYSKGAPEVLLARCVAERRSGQVRQLSAERRREILEIGAEMAGRALRLLALAYRELPRQAGAYQEVDLIFAGLAGMIDPPREEARAAVRKCHEAGIRPIMITGDHPETARAIARELSIATAGARVVTGRKLDALSDDQLVAEVEHIPVYARVSAEHKLRIVRAWKKRGQVVAMTGDGVNDAPAIKAADIGIAMGITGTDVTKEAADVVLTDDNFASIVNAIEEGRGIFDNIQKFLQYLLSSNASEILFIFFAALAGWPAPLLAVQLLWINLVTDSLPALALGMEPPERDIMRRQPRPPHEPVITWQRGLLMLVHGGLIAGVTACGFAWVYQGDEEKLGQARTAAFCLIAYAQLFYAFACRSQRSTLPELGFFSNPHLFAAVAISSLLQLGIVSLAFLRPVFSSTDHPVGEWLLVLVLALIPVTALETAKLARAWRTRRGSQSPAIAVTDK